MKVLNKIFGAALVLATLAGLAVGGTALASNDLCPKTKPANVSQEAYDRIKNSEVCRNQSDPIAGPGGLISDITNVVAVVAGIAAVIMIMYGGFKYITSTGESSKVQEAKRIIIWSLVGLVVIVLARSIILFVLERI